MNRLLALVFGLVAVAAGASQVVAHTLADRVKMSDRVALVQVVDQHVVAENGDPQKLLTYTDVVLGEDVKGKSAERFTIVQIGGELGPWRVGIPGDAHFTVGESAIVFLKCFPTGRCGLVALQEGKMKVDRDGVRVHDLFHDTWSVRPLKDVLAELRAAGKAKP